MKFIFNEIKNSLSNTSQNNNILKTAFLSQDNQSFIKMPWDASKWKSLKKVAQKEDKKLAITHCLIVYLEMINLNMIM